MRDSECETKTLELRTLDFGVFAYLDIGLLNPEPSQGIPMKKLLTAIAAAVFIIYPSICFASYVIHLKDGREFVTGQYSEEGEQMKFKRYGGAIGIQKDLVRGVEEIKDCRTNRRRVTKQTASLTAEKGPVRRKHSRISLMIGLMP